MKAMTHQELLYKNLRQRVVLFERGIKNHEFFIKQATRPDNLFLKAQGQEWVDKRLKESIERVECLKLAKVAATDLAELVKNGLEFDTVHYGIFDIVPY